MMGQGGKNDVLPLEGTFILYHMLELHVIYYM